MSQPDKRKRADESCPGIGGGLMAWLKKQLFLDPVPSAPPLPPAVPAGEPVRTAPPETPPGAPEASSLKPQDSSLKPQASSLKPQDSGLDLDKIAQILAIPIMPVTARGRCGCELCRIEEAMGEKRAISLRFRPPDGALEELERAIRHVKTWIRQRPPWGRCQSWRSADGRSITTGWSR